ncbi:MAG: metal ABC transporter solute-binding protein, Zn/Mn family [Erysipelotrichaceae bacterium]
MKKFIKILIITTMLLTILSGCVVKRIKVCSTIYPIQYLLEKIGGNRIDTCNIGDNTQIIRSSLSPTYRIDLVDATTIMYAGGVEPYLDLYSSEFLDAGYSLLDATMNANLYLFKRYTIIKTNNEFLAVDSKYYPETDLFDNVDLYNNDPYVWLDPIAFTSMARTMTDYLIKNQPLDEEYFNNNYEELESELANLDAQYQELKNNVVPKFVTVTPSFGNWQKSYGVEIYPTILSRYGVVPNQQQQNYLIEYIKNKNIKYIAYETNLPDDIQAFYDKLVNELSLKPIKLYNLSFITDEQVADGEDYLSLMKANLRSLQELQGE